MKRIVMMLALALAVALSSIAANYVTVTGTDVRLRLQPSLQSETLTNDKGVNIHPTKGQRLECVGETKAFYKVKFNGQVVYISKKFAKADAPAAPATKKAVAAADGQRYVTVTGTGVRLRLQPSLEGKTLQRNGVNVHPKKGERIKLMGEEGDFYKVNYQGNYVYIHKDYASVD
ncbi:MAG: hypothetical protein II786_06465 [Muribaculaceae bacterium]|nr:hypothetical protein [Muribaculaceae bacterium]MBR3101735.1 hypothetical protein [Muribaculaceae bacterium]